jgi:hypothetical protein
VTDRHQSYVAALRSAVLDGPGSLDAPLRAALAFGGDAPEALTVYAATVRDSAYAMVDADVTAVINAGYTEDQVYEATVSVALGAGVRRLDAAIAAIDASFAATPEPAPAAESVTEPVADEAPWEPVVVAGPPLERRVPRSAPETE